MLAELTFKFNFLALIEQGELMQIDILPENALIPAQLPAAQQPALVYLSSIGESSRQTMWSALSLICVILTKGACSPVTLPWHELRRQHVNAVRAWLVANRAPATGRRIISALRGTLHEAAELGLMSFEECKRAINIKPIRGEGPPQAAGRAISPGEFTAILSDCEHDLSPTGVRNALIFGLGMRGGLRRAEIANLRLTDYNPSTNSLRVHGKGYKIRTVPLAPGVDAALADWLHIRNHLPADFFANSPDAADRLLLQINKGGTILPLSISPQAIYDVVKKHAKRAKLTQPLSPHDMRRDFISRLLGAGVDLSIAQKLAGHASPTTTAGYDRRPEEAKVEATQRLHMPYARRFT